MFEVTIPQPNGNPAIDWRIWQLIDSAFPVGGFAHSAGLEAAWQSGWIRNPQQVESFVIESLEQIAHSALPFVAAAIAGTDLATLDLHWDSLLSNHVANRASRQQGMMFLSTAAEVFDLQEVAALREKMLRAGGPAHYAVMFGAVMRAMQVEPSMAARAYLFIAMRGILSAGVRLGVIGPIEAQRLQVTLDGPLGLALARAAALSIEEACQTSPLLELLQMGQDRLYSRLFQS